MESEDKNSPAQSMPPTARSLPIALIRARENVMAPIRRMLSRSNITEQQWRVLRVLEESGPLDSSVVAERACILLPSLTRIARSMSARGLIARKQDEDDRRRQKLSLTPAGQKFIDDNLAEAYAIAVGVREKLGADRYETLLDILEDLARD